MKIAKFEFSLFGINTYVVFDIHSKECVIIDPGMINDEEREAMRRFISTNDLKVTGIINTHMHVDHVIADQWSKKAFDAPIMAHIDDLPLGERVKEQAQMFGVPLETENVIVDRWLVPGDKIKVGDGELEVIHVPGHSKGSIALYDAADGFLISGDALFAGSIGRTDLPGGSMPQLIDSIKSRLLTLPGDTIVYPGHGPATTISKEKRQNSYLK